MNIMLITITSLINNKIFIIHLEIMMQEEVIPIMIMTNILIYSMIIRCMQSKDYQILMMIII